MNQGEWGAWATRAAEVPGVRQWPEADLGVSWPVPQGPRSLEAWPS